VRADGSGADRFRFSVAVYFCVIAGLCAIVHPGATAECETCRTAGKITELPVPDLRVYLTDGFADDHVVISVDGRTVFDQTGITTKKMIGLAKQVAPVPVPGDTAKLEVKLPEKNLAATFDVDLSKGSHVPVTLENGRLLHSVQKQIGFM
jgi:hypothetical protein